VARSRVLERVPNADDLLLKPFNPASEPLRHVKRYITFLLQGADAPSDPALLEHIRSTLLDLVVLALGSARESTELERLRGLRAARVNEIISLIRAGFTDPSFSVGSIAQKVRVSPRYVNDLLHSTGESFTERVLELRLQKARTMLNDPRHDRLLVSSIAYECGFNDISYFNRCFKKRFGETPKGFRGLTEAQRRQESNPVVQTTSNAPALGFG
jgi:AraC-like DNA-binding protein